MHEYIQTQYVILAAAVAAFVSFAVLMVTAVLVEEWN